MDLKVKVTCHRTFNASQSNAHHVSYLVKSVTGIHTYTDLRAAQRHALAGRKTRSGSQRSPIVSNHVNGENRPAACESLWRKCHLLGYERMQQEGQSGTLRQGRGRKRR